MAQVMPWGGEYSLIAELSLPANPFTLNNATLGVLDGNCYLDGRVADDLTDRVLSIAVSRGRHDQFQDFQSATMAITLSNNDRELDPVNQSSRYWDPITQTSGVTIRRRVTLYYGATAIFTGLITDIDISYDPTSAPNTRSTVEISVADDFVVFANTYLDEFLPANELSGARINTILNLPEVDYSGATDVDSGTVTCLDDPIPFGTRALDALQQVAATERGYLFMTGNGVLKFTDRVVGTPVVEKVFADDTTGVEYNTLSIVYGQENLFNRVICTPVDSTNPGVAENAASISTFGVSALSLNNLLFSDAAAQDLAEYMLELYQLPSYRFDGMTIVFAGNQVSLVDQQQIIGLDLGDTVRIIKTFSVGTPAQIYQNVTIEHVDHRISPNAHEITFMFSPASFTTYAKTATGSGQSSQTATGLHIADRTAVGTGSATTGDTAVGLHIAPRTATGGGTGGSSANRLVTKLQTATGSGVGSGTAVNQITIPLRLDDPVNGILDLNVLGEYNTRIRTATGSGGASTGDTATWISDKVRTATGSGTGNATTVGVKTLVLILDSSTMGKLDTNTLGS